MYNGKKAIRALSLVNTSHAKQTLKRSCLLVSLIRYVAWTYCILYIGSHRITTLSTQGEVVTTNSRGFTFRYLCYLSTNMKRLFVWSNALISGTSGSN